MSFTLKPEEIEVLSLISEAVKAAAAPYFVLGAKGRNLLFEKFHIAQLRATNDWDVAIALDSWKAYREITEHLFQRGFGSTNVEHRFVYKKLVVDILPFGGVESRKGVVRFLKSEMEMQTHYFPYAMQRAQSVAIAPGLEIPVVSPEAFIVLKIMAWQDRKSSDDAKDIRDILENYEKLTSDGAYDEIEALEPENDYRLSYAKLAGARIASSLSEEELSRLKMLVSNILDDSNAAFIYSMRRSLHLEEEEFLASLMAAFREGVER